MNPTLSYHVLEFTGAGYRRQETPIIRETSLRILVNGKDLISLQCSGTHPHFLATGFLFSCGIITSAQDVTALEVDEKADAFEVRVALRESSVRLDGLTVTSGLGWNTQPGRSELRPLPDSSGFRLRSEAILQLAQELHARSDLYRLTRGCHNASLCSPEAMLLFRSDIGRHNAIDTIVGQCLVENIRLDDKLLLSTGRIASEIVCKAVRAGVPALASTSMPTSQAIEYAKRYNLTLIGNITESGFCVYSDNERL